MRMRIAADDWAWFQEHPMLWWAATARWEMGRVAPTTEPGIEMDENEVPTGYVLMAHPNIDAWDLLLLDICLAGKAFAEAQVDPAGTVAYQLAVDTANFMTLMGQMEAGAITRDQALRAIKANAITQAATLGVVLPPMDDDLNIIVPEEEILP